MAVKGNTLRENPKDPVKEKKERKHADEPKRDWFGGIRRFYELMQEERSQQIIGAVLMFFSLYLATALASYLSYWTEDQDTFNSVSAFHFLFDKDIVVHNWLGKMGALLAHVLIQKWFGVASFLFAPLFFIAGLRLIFRYALLPQRKTTLYTCIAILWTSCLLGFTAPDKLSYLGGGFGYHTSQYLNGIIGFIGTGLLLFFSMVIFVFSAFKISFIREIMPSKSELHEEDADNTTTPVNTFVGEVRAENVLRQAQEANENENALRQAQGTIEDEPVSENDSEIEALEEEPPLTSSGNEEEIVEEDDAESEEAEMVDEEPELELEVEEQPEIPSSELPAMEVVEPKPEGDLDFSIETPQEEVMVEPEETQMPMGEYDPTLELSSYQFPTIDLLEQYVSKKVTVDKEELELNKNKIVQTLGHYNIAIASIKAIIGPTVTLYEIVPAAGVRISKIKNLEDDIALSLSALGIRIIAPIPGKGTIGIEVPNQKPEVVSMSSVISSEKFQNSTFDLPIGLGKTISNEVFIADLAKMPHLLMAGATGQGKSVGLNAVLVSLLYKKHPSQIKFVLVDPKKVELTLFKRIERHFLAKLPGEGEAIITDTKKVVNTLNSLCIEMDLRYDLLKQAEVRNLKEYNAKFIARKLNPNKGHKFLPYIVLVVDEFADLIMTAGKEVETPIARLAQLARAIGIHLIIATQRPSVNIITGTIKANFPARMAFRVTSKIDSRTILDAGGADQLIGRGDMLVSSGSDLIRIQCAFVDTPEVERITEFIGNQRGYPDAFLLPEYIDDTVEGPGEIEAGDRDKLFEESARMVVQHQQGSASLLQRRLKLGYNRAGRIIDQLEAAGIIGPFEGSKAREVLIKDMATLEQFLKGGDAE